MASTDGMLLLDDEFKIVWINTAARKLLRLDKSEAIGLPFNIGAAGSRIGLDITRPDGSTGVGSVRVSGSQVDGKSMYVATIEDVSDDQMSLQRLTETALYDALTGLPNRRLFTSRIDQSILRVERRGGAVGLLFVDVDHFKAINDSYGHAAGDAVLTEVARRLSVAVRHTDSVARLGGDEFIAIIDSKSPEKLRTTAVLRRIQLAFAEPVDIGSTSIDVRLSIGTAQYEPGSDLTAEQLMRRADIAMYREKEKNRDN